MKMRSKSGFTLLEIIIVVIIIGVLASLALPRFFRTVEYSRASEALNSLTALRGATERFYAARNTYAAVVLTSLDVEDPGVATNAHFAYSYVSTPYTTVGYTIRATRNSIDNGTVTDIITLSVVSGGTITRAGTTAFAGVQ